ncbi:MAG: ABC-three component system middle component 6 [Sulfuricellaceae bacterium]
MNIPAQLLPHKHIRFCESLIGLAGYVRQLLETPKTIDDLYLILNRSDSGWLYKPTFEQLVSAVIILFAIGQVIEKDNTLQVVT